MGTAIVVQGSPLTGIEHMARQFWSTEGETGVYLMLDTEPEEGMTDARMMEPSAFPGLYTSNRIVVDSLSSVIIKYGIDVGLECLSTAKKDVAARNANILFTFYSDLHTPREEIQILRLADVIIELKEVIFMNEIERQLAVHKVKKMAVPKRLIPFNITEKGIELSTTSRVV